MAKGAERDRVVAWPRPHARVTQPVVPSPGSQEDVPVPSDDTSRHSRLTRYPSPGVNSLWRWRSYVPLRKAARNFLIIYLCRYLPSLRWKNRLYRLVGVRVGEHASAGLSATLDVFFPELISLGDNCV